MSALLFDQSPPLLPGVIERFLRSDFFLDLGVNGRVSNDPIYPWPQPCRWRAAAVAPLGCVCDEPHRRDAGVDGASRLPASLVLPVGISVQDDAGN